jgi:2-amino-4-hydroxy-6-hydroxymethyldihydropteridine diphosphokinase
MAEGARWVPAYVGLGANLGEPLQQLRKALDLLVKIPLTRLVAVSAAYRSRPMGPQDQPSYINAVAGLLSSLDPDTLLDHLQAIERIMGRIRSGQRWGPRVIDLDLLLFGGKFREGVRLVLPHPGVHERSFVLYPLADIAPDISIPGQGVVKLLLADIPADDIERLEEQLTI